MYRDDCGKGLDSRFDGDMPSWMFKEESNGRKLRIETQRRSQPSSRRMLTMVNKMSKSKTALWKANVLLDQF